MYDIHGESHGFPQATVKLEADKSDDYDGYGDDTRRWICEDGELKEIVKVETVDENAEGFESQDYADITDPDQALTLGLWVQWPGGPVDLKSYWPPKKLTGPPKN